MRLTKKHENQAVSKVLQNAAKQIETQGTAVLKPGSYPFDLSISVTGELLVKKGSDAGEEVTVADFSPNDVLRGILANAENPDQLVSDALGWHKSSGEEAKKAQDELTACTLLACAKRRRMTKSHSTPAKAGAVSAKPSVSVSGTVGQRAVAVEVKAA